ncbi:hypothetical protein ACE01N_13860 [Saccharicrinis sp. FJH2]|uniref:hypothetical protein n=1 Tax=Saccharicrinis sp. FJH65 TaxID=3344659 RepID=UPI0035F3F7F0
MGLRKSYHIYLLILLISCFISTTAYSQYYGYNKGYDISKGLSVSVMFGPTIFAGDLGMELFQSEASKVNKQNNYMGISYGVLFVKDIVEAASVRLQFNRGTLQGTRLNEDGNPLLEFNTNLKYEMSLGAHVNINNIIGGYYNYRIVNFYTITSLMILSYDHQAMLGSAHPAYVVGGDNTDRTHYPYLNGVPETQTIFMTKLGGGARFRVDNNWSVNFELTGNLPLSSSMEGADLLDGYQTYSDGTPTKYSDFYYTVQVGVQYTFKSNGFRSLPKYNRKSYKYKYKRFKYNPGRKRLLRR